MSWHGLKGHGHLVEMFRRSAQRGRLAHTYLFVGPQGIGKKTFAVTLAQGLLCETAALEALDPCGACTGCRQVEAGTHPDFFLLGLPPEKHELPIELFIGVRERRHQEGLCHDLSLKPARGRRKIAVIDDADRFNTESANCLLKTLEEPPAHSLVILIGTSTDRQLPTIRSRCQVVRFAPLERDHVAQLLLEQGIVSDRGYASSLAEVSGGSVGRAAELADPDLWEFRCMLFRELSDPSFDSVEQARRVVEFVEAVDKDSAPRRARARQVVGFCAEFYRNVLLLSCGVEPVPIAAADLAAYQQLRTHLAADELQPEDLERLAALVDRCLEAEYHIDRRVHLALALECLFDDLSRRMLHLTA